MNRSAPSINAVLANERFHAERQEKAPESPISPTSPTPSFSWPRRVRSPEPHVPLRKASPERLHQRTKKPPLFVTTNAGNHGLGPTTASSVAVPYQTRVDAAHKNWWEDVENTHNYNHNNSHNHNHNHNLRNSYNDNNNNNNLHHSLGHDQRKLSAVEHTSPIRQRQLSAADHTSPIRQRQFSAADATRKGSWPLPPPLDDRFGDRNGSTISVPESTPEELMRTSYRSAMTSSSSHMDSTIDTTRSSVATADSSVSDIVKIDSSWTDEHNQDEDEDFTVDDALDMYLGGFGTPNKLSVDIRNSIDIRGSIDSRRGSYARSSLDNTHLRPGSSPLKHGSELNRLHRRSHSASVVDRKSVLLDIDAVNAAIASRHTNTSDPAKSTKGPPPLHLDIKPVLNHTRTSTDIITGRDLPSSRPPSAPVNVPRDRYGFKKISHHITLEQYDAWEKPYNEHLERRRGKWNALMKQFGYTTDNPSRFPTKSEKVKRYIRKGIPPDWRGAAWFWYAGGPGKLAKDPGLYWNLLQEVRNGKLSDNDREHIERDLNRTFPDNIRFKPDPGTGANPEDEPSMIKALRRLLQTFAVHNPNIGYCQSLNFIAGLLLLFLDEDEEKAFVLLNVVTTQHLPGTHGVALEGANIDIQVLMTSIKESLPSIWQKLDDKPTTPGPGGAPRLPTVSLATTAWFMSLFVGTLPIECVLRVWDCLFFEGSKTLFRVALAIFKSGEQKIKSVNDPMEIFQVVQTMPRGMLDANALMECCFKKRGGFGGLSQDVVEKRREEGREATRQGRSLTDDMGKKSLMRGKSRGRFGIKTKSAVH